MEPDRGTKAARFSGSSIGESRIWLVLFDHGVLSVKESRAPSDAYERVANFGRQRQSLSAVSLHKLRPAQDMNSLTGLCGG